MTRLSLVHASLICAHLLGDGHDGVVLRPGRRVVAFAVVVPSTCVGTAGAEGHEEGWAEGGELHFFFFSLVGHWWGEGS
jgi:hypothetical protein